MEDTEIARWESEGGYSDQSAWNEYADTYTPDRTVRTPMLDIVHHFASQVGV